MELLITLTIKSTLVILVSGLLLLALKRSTATLRHWVISLTMIGLLGLPLFIELLPTKQVEVPFIPKQVIVKTQPKPRAVQPTVDKKIVAPITTPTTKVGDPVVIDNKVFSKNKTLVNSQLNTNRPSTSAISLSTWIKIIWLLGACYFFAGFIWGLYHIWSITRNSHPFMVPARLQESILKITPQKIQFLISPTIKTPMTWGAFRPVVLLPTAAHDWTNKELQAVLVHELSHIKRKDYWIHTLGLLAVCLYWYNPLIWWMKKQQLLEREKACDEAVLRTGVQRQSYAEQLLQITRCLKKQPSMISENALPMAKVSQIKKRVVAILNFEDTNYKFSTWKQWQWGLFYGSFFPVLAVLSPIGQQVIKEHFQLPVLETVTQYLDTKELSTVIKVDIFAKDKEAITNDTKVDNVNATILNSDNPTFSNEVVHFPSIKTLPSSLPTSAISSSIKINIPSPSALPNDTLPTGNITLQEQIQARLVNLHQVSNANENFEGFEGLKKAIGDADIVTLGEQTHSDATTFETKIKLIKYLHQEMGFDIVTFESNLYECQRAWSMVEKGHNVKDALGKSIFATWSALEELNPLYDYVEKQLDTDHPLRITGFDHQMVGKIGRDHFINDLKSYFSNIKDATLYNDQFYELQAFLSLVRLGKTKTFKKKRAVASIAFLKELSEQIKSKPLNEQSSFWLQSIKSLELFISDMKLGTDFREQQMAENLVWLKERYPNKKIICWGATSHFLYNADEVRTKSKVVQVLAANYYKKQRMMGDYLKEKYEDNIYTIGFTAYEGVNGYSLKPPPPNSVEYLIGTAKADNYFLPLHGLSLEGYMSRPLGNKYMTNDIAQVMDGVIFNRKMKLPYTDWDFFMYVVPENKYIPKKLDRLKKYQQKSKEKENTE